MPRWGTWTLLLTWAVAAAASVGGYLASHSWLVVGMFCGIAFIVTVGVANAAQLMKRDGR